MQMDKTPTAPCVLQWLLLNWLQTTYGDCVNAYRVQIVFMRMQCEHKQCELIQSPMFL